ncbi:MAG: hypothetical protein J6T33_09760 [Bacteroidales bacterium]|nr:hypothetical protein [Bacteroidales bacterium]
MIKLNSKGTAPDYTEYGSVSTDCVTVGQFMTEAAATYGGGLTIKVDGDRYEFSDNPKIRVTDHTPIEEIAYTSVPRRVTFIVTTRPKPKTVKKSGWVNIYRASFDNYKTKTNTDNRRLAPQVYNSKEAAEQAVRLLSDPVERQMFIATVRVDWEEVEK